MKKVLVLMSIFSISLFNCQEQKISTNSLLGIQAGLFGANVYYESSLTENFVLRGEVDLAAGIWGGDLYNKTGFALSPEFVVSPKWYYNITKRGNETKNVKNNSANYLSARIGYVPSIFVISNTDGIKVNPMVSIVPTWGFRRNFAKNFNYEFQIGLGIGKILKPGYDLQAVSNLSLRLGYDL